MGNKADLPNPVAVNLAQLQREHPNVIGFYPLSCKAAHALPSSRWDAEFKAFRAVFAEQITQLAERGARLTDPQFRALREAQRRAQEQDFISEEEFKQLCRDEGLSEERIPDMLDLFDKLGVVLHFKQLPFLSDYVLNPRWLTYGVYTVLYSDAARRQEGRLSNRDLAGVLRKAKVKDRSGRTLSYEGARGIHVREAMCAFKTAYRLDNERLVIPSLLPVNEPAHGFDAASAIAFRLSFDGLLPPQLLSRMIVDRHRDIAQNGDAVWRSGAVLAPAVRQAQALIEANDQDRALNIFVTGPDATLYLGDLRETALGALSNMPGLPYEEQIRLDPEMAVDEPSHVYPLKKVWTNFRNADAMYKAGEKYLWEKGQRYVLAQVMGHAPIPDDLRHAEVFLSYSHQDPELVQDVGNRLLQSGVKVWWDRSLKPAEQWRLDILKRLNEVKAVAVIWTDASAASSFVRAEADHGHKLNRLISLLGPGFAFNNIPPPFGETQQIPMTTLTTYARP